LQQCTSHLRMKLQTGDWVKPQKMAFQTFVTQWKENYANQNLGAYTRKNYMDIIDKRLIPEFGHLQLDRIKTMNVVTFMTKLRGTESPQGRTKKTAGYKHRTEHLQGFKIDFRCCSPVEVNRQKPHRRRSSTRRRQEGKEGYQIEEKVIYD
jgi:hypothetical protein